MVTLVSCAIFTAFTGASGVTIIALGGLLFPILINEHYPEKFSLGLLTTSGSLGLLFPPSLPLILYAMVASNARTIGGSVRGNAGCFSGEMKDVISRVRYFDTETGRYHEEGNSFCKFAYRDSIFKSMPQYIITRADLELRPGNVEIAQRLVRFYSRSRSDAQDIGSASAGCIFKNVSWPQEEEKRNHLLCASGLFKLIHGN